MKTQSGLAATNFKKPGMYNMGGGLYLQVRRGAKGQLRKGWVLRTFKDGGEKKLGLGNAVEINLTEARKKAEQLQDAKAAGRDVKIARDVGPGKMTYRKAVDGYLAVHGGSLKNAKHREQWRTTLDGTCTVMGDLDVEQIEPAHVVKVLKADWLRVPDTSRRVRGRIKNVIDFAIAAGARKAGNPAELSILRHLLPRQPTRSTRHHPSLPYPELPDFWKALLGEEGLAAIAMQVAILTAVRTNEVLAMRWPEVDLGGALWSIPEERMKMTRAHRVPLTPGVVAVLAPLVELRQCDFVFPGVKKFNKPWQPLSEMSMLMALRRMDRDDITVHGFRTTFRTWAEKTRSEKEIKLAKIQLAHVESDKVDAAYMRDDMLDERRGLMQAWDDYVRAAPPAPLMLPAPPLRLVASGKRR